MRNKKLILKFVAAILLICSCGGVAGNLKCSVEAARFSRRIRRHVFSRYGLRSMAKRYRQKQKAMRQKGGFKLELPPVWKRRKLRVLGDGVLKQEKLKENRNWQCDGNCACGQRGNNCHNHDYDNYYYDNYDEEQVALLRKEVNDKQAALLNLNKEVNDKEYEARCEEARKSLIERIGELGDKIDGGLNSEFAKMVSDVEKSCVSHAKKAKNEGLSTKKAVKEFNKKLDDDIIKTLKDRVIALIAKFFDIDSVVEKGESEFLKERFNKIFDYYKFKYFTEIEEVLKPRLLENFKKELEKSVEPEPSLLDGESDFEQSCDDEALTPEQNKVFDEFKCALVNLNELCMGAGFKTKQEQLACEEAVLGSLNSVNNYFYGVVSNIYGLDEASFAKVVERACVLYEYMAGEVQNSVLCVDGKFGFNGKIVESLCVFAQLGDSLFDGKENNIFRKLCVVEPVRGCLAKI